MKNDNTGWYVFISACIIMFTSFALVPGNEIYNAPAFNKILGFGLVGSAFFMGYVLKHDLFSFTKNDKGNYFAFLSIIILLTVLGLFTLAIWHK